MRKNKQRLKMHRFTALILALACVFGFAGCAKKEADTETLKANPSEIIFKALKSSLSASTNIAYNPLDKGAEAAQSGEISAVVHGTEDDKINCALTRSAQKNYFKTTYDNGNTWGCILYKDQLYIQPDINAETYYALSLSNLEDDIRKSALPKIMNMDAAIIIREIRKHYPKLLAESQNEISDRNIDEEYLKKAMDLILAQPAAFHAETLNHADKEQSVSKAEYEISNTVMYELGMLLEEWRASRGAADPYIDDVFYQMFVDAGIPLEQEDREEEMDDKAVGDIIFDICYHAKYKEANGKIVFYLDAENENVLLLQASFTDKNSESPVTLMCKFTFALSEKDYKQNEFLYEMQGDYRATLGKQIRWSIVRENRPARMSSLTSFEYKVGGYNWKQVEGIEYNKQNSAFTIRSMYNREELVMNGTVSAVNEMRMHIGKINYMSEEYAVDIDITAVPKDIEVTAPNATNISALTEEEMRELYSVFAESYPDAIFGKWEVNT